MFNVNGYETLMRDILEKQFIFSKFTNFRSLNHYALLRHDIDFSPFLALKMAQVENRLGIKSTYFFMLRSPFYNLLSRANDRIVREIIDLGHSIGLHYDEGYYPKSLNIQELIDNEIDVLEKNFDINIDVVSFHQPSQKIIDNEISIKQINTYDKTFFKDIKYVSDSNMQFKEDPLEVIKSSTYRKIQLLIHPMWWMIEGETTEKKFVNTMKLNFEIEQQQVLQTERAYGKKKNIKFEESI